jgi:hypothetical protein
MIHLPANRAPSRRDFLQRAGGGLGLLALLDLVADDGLFPDARAEETTRPEPAATSVINLFMYGGPSQVDTFDYKPELQARDGQTMPGGERLKVFFGSPGPLLASSFKFARHGQSGQWVSELLPGIAGVIDEIALIRSMHADSNNHAPALFQMNTGRTRPGNPSLGSWVTYGLGSENRSLPGFVVLADDRGGPIGGAPNWGAGYLPGAFQGTPFRGAGTPILDLEPPACIPESRRKADRDLLDRLNREHLEAHPGEPELQARIESYELAYRMQAEAPEAVDLTRESKETKRLYGLDNPTTESFGRRLLIARRLVERGVRFIQVYSGCGGNFDDLNWDAHNNLAKNHRLHAAATDAPIAGLILDLKRRGLLDKTLVAWGGEFGRMPVSQAKIGRDHNPHGFTTWLAGGGVKGGVSVGATDDFGYKAVEERCHVNDWHATILHLLGLDHKALTYLHNGRRDRLTDVGGRVITGVLRNPLVDRKARRFDNH